MDSVTDAATYRRRGRELLRRHGPEDGDVLRRFRRDDRVGGAEAELLAVVREELADRRDGYRRAVRAVDLLDVLVGEQRVADVAQVRAVVAEQPARDERLRQCDAAEVDAALEAVEEPRDVGDGNVARGRGGDDGGVVGVDALNERGQLGGRDPVLARKRLTHVRQRAERWDSIEGGGEAETLGQIGQRAERHDRAGGQGAERPAAEVREEGNGIATHEDHVQAAVDREGRQRRGQGEGQEVVRQRPDDHAGTGGAGDQLIEHGAVLRRERGQRREVGRRALADGAEEVIAADPDGDEGRLQGDGLVDFRAETAEDDLSEAGRWLGAG